MESINTSLSTKTKKEVISALSKELANYQVFYATLQNFHWHVKGENFFDLHIKLEEMYNAVFEKIDQTAERIVGLGGTAPASLSEYINLTTLTEYKGSSNKDSKEMVNALVQQLEKIIDSHRKSIEVCEAEENFSDELTIDMLVGFLGDLEKDLWMLSKFNA